jgi:hypothetical protein
MQTILLTETNANLTAHRWNWGYTASQRTDVTLLNTYDTHIVLRMAGMLQGRTEGGRSTVLQEQDSRICTLHQGSDRRGGVGHVARMGDSTSAYGVLVRKPAEKRPLGRRRRRRKSKVTARLWLRVRTNGVLFNRAINLLFVRKMRGISLLAAGTISFSRTLPQGVS